jgi:hypothetical protein
MINSAEQAEYLRIIDSDLISLWVALGRGRGLFVRLVSFVFD